MYCECGTLLVSGGNVIKEAWWEAPTSDKVDAVGRILEDVRATMYNVDRIFQALQLVVSQSGTDGIRSVEVLFPQVRQAGTEATWSFHLVRMLGAAFGALSNVTSRQPEAVHLRVEGGAGVSPGVYDSALELVQTLRSQRGAVKVAPLCEVAAMLLGAV